MGRGATVATHLELRGGKSDWIHRSTSSGATPGSACLHAWKPHSSGAVSAGGRHQTPMQEVCLRRLPRRVRELRDAGGWACPDWVGWTGRAAPEGIRQPRPPCLQVGARQGAWLSWLRRLEPQHHTAWGALAQGPASHLPWAGPGAPQSLSPLPPPSRTPTPLSLPPHLTLAKTSKSNVLLSNSVQSTRGVLCCLPSYLAAVWGASLASFTPAWGSACLTAAKDGSLASSGFGSAPA
jgi:hypothetical protein